MQLYYILALCGIFSGIYAAPMKKDLLAVTVAKLDGHLLKREDSADRAQASQPLGAFKGLAIPDIFPNFLSSHPLGDQSDQD